MGLQLMAGHHVTNSANLFDAVTLSAMGRVNLHNLFLGYQGQPRDFEVDLTFGMGYGRNFYPNPKGDNGYILAKGGFNFNWNLGETKAWTVSVRPALVVSQEDLFTITKYMGMDPEVNQNGNSGTVQGLDYGTYPQTRSFVLGLNIAF